MVQSANWSGMPSAKPAIAEPAADELQHGQFAILSAILTKATGKPLRGSWQEDDR